MKHVRELDTDTEDMFHRILGTRADEPLSYKLVNLYWRYKTRYNRCGHGGSLPFGDLVHVTVLADCVNVEGEPEIVDEDYGKWAGWADVDRYTRVRFKRSNTGGASRVWLEGKYIKQESRDERTLRVKGFTQTGREREYVLPHDNVTIDRRNGGA